MNSNGARTAEDRRSYNDATVMDATVMDARVMDATVMPGYVADPVNSANPAGLADAVAAADAAVSPDIADVAVSDQGGGENGGDESGGDESRGIESRGDENDGDGKAVAAAPELRSLCDQVAGLVDRLPGRLRRIAVGGADHFVEIEWHGDDPATTMSLLPPPPPSLPSGPLGLVRPPAPAPATAGPTADDGPAVDPTPEPGHVVVAPLVGTFYRAPEPGAPAFVEVGDLVEPGQTIGIVEAMKLMNPIVSETAGRISAIYVDNGQGVEFGEDLIRVSTDPD